MLNNGFKTTDSYTIEVKDSTILVEELTNRLGHIFNKISVTNNKRIKANYFEDGKENHKLHKYLVKLEVKLEHSN